MKISFAVKALLFNFCLMELYKCDQDQKISDEFESHLKDDHLDEEMFPNGRPQKCYALALSDATNLGPYQAGVIKGLVHELKYTSGSSGTMYEVVSGVALGAINAHILSQFKLGHEEEAVEKLEDFWYTLADRNNELVVPWSWGMIYGFFYE